MISDNCLYANRKVLVKPIGENLLPSAQSGRLCGETATVHHVARHQTRGLRFHDLRQSYTTWLVDDGVPPNMVRRVMGHERSSTTLDDYRFKLLRLKHSRPITRCRHTMSGEEVSWPDQLVAEVGMPARRAASSSTAVAISRPSMRPSVTSSCSILTSMSGSTTCKAASQVDQ
jgi:hypothetical protein